MDSQKEYSVANNFKSVNYEPKRENRILVRLPEKLNIQEWIPSSADLPKYINGEWAEISISFKDIIGQSVSERLSDLITDENKELVYMIEVLDSTGWVVEIWYIKSNVVAVDFGTADYSSDKLLTPKITVKPETCSLIPGSPKPDYITS